MNDERVRVSIDELGIADVAMTRVDKMNALDAAMFDALRAAIERLRREAGLRAVVLHGEGRAFCAGLDKSSFEQMGSDAGGDSFGDIAERTHGLANAWQQVAWGWRELPVPVIAAVHGVAYGGGLQIALGADVRCVQPEAQLSVMEIRWGLVPDMAGCVLMTELARADVVRDLVYSGRVVSGSEAQTLGLATRVSAEPLSEARALARRIAGHSPTAVRAAKRLLNGASPVNASCVLMAESLEQQRLIGSPHQVEAVTAALENRPPRYR